MGGLELRGKGQSAAMLLGVSGVEMAFSALSPQEISQKIGSRTGKRSECYALAP